MSTSSFPRSSVTRYPGFHCGVVGCCAGQQPTHEGWHGIGSAVVVYTVQPCAERKLMLTVRTGVFPPSVTWVEEKNKKPYGVDISWFQQQGPTEDDHASTSSGLDAEDFYASLQAEHGTDLVPDDVVLDALLKEASMRWPGELLAVSPVLARTPVSARGSWLSAAWLRFAAIFLAFGAMCSCSPAPDAPDAECAVELAAPGRWVRVVEGSRLRNHNVMVVNDDRAEFVNPEDATWWVAPLAENEEDGDVP